MTELINVSRFLSIHSLDSVVCNVNELVSNRFIPALAEIFDKTIRHDEEKRDDFDEVGSESDDNTSFSIQSTNKYNKNIVEANDK